MRLGPVGALPGLDHHRDIQMNRRKRRFLHDRAGCPDEFGNGTFLDLEQEFVVDLHSLMKRSTSRRKI